MPFPATHPALARALDARGYADPTPVQEAVLRPETEGRDLLVSAQTGSGKTVAYGLAAAGTLLGEAEQMGRAGAPLALVVAPTRELAMQVHRELSWLYAETGARIVSCIGGMEPRRETRALEAGCHIVVGTPGRLCDHLQRGGLDLSALRVLVLDEADEMLDLGFREELERLLGASPEERRTLLFSATIAPDIAALARSFQRDALRIDTLVRNQPHADIEYRAVRVAPYEVGHAVVNVLRYFEAPGALVFCATREAVRHLHGSLVERGFTAVALSGELTQNERSRALQSLRDGHARVCVATDVAARGLDLPDLGLVIHADLPVDKAVLLHRSGRTGRAGRKGVCVLVVPANRVRRAEQLLSLAGVTANWSAAPTAEAIRACDGERLLRDPILAEEPTPEDADLVRQLAEGRSPEELAAALLRVWRAHLPAPEELADASGPVRRQPRAVGTERPSRRPREAGDESATAPSGRTRAPREDGPKVWFSVNLGRRAKADPKWLVPLICRLGGVNKRDIGAIRVFDEETKFEIAEATAAAFTATWPSGGEDDVRLSPTGAPSFAPRREGGPRRPERASFGRRKPQRD
ncbi:DEAD/DEAH box helicase [Rhodovastum atsumiense]|uniref:DEAD/DEAH box helicase n=1 Tax=Rhodovastum atsumiense TaxID=504468 RepID=A0A5M6INX0_9PROT|nr:DEAD/DEAH box helicase [Rhodovastum atsumiense]KAA5609258.1 DEAD/DEAH box helicase [Rhodovastum atsumiense]CAH2601712.1 DEAD/DEAH box helicase [Rhodovastum atsumiense]